MLVIVVIILMVHFYFMYVSVIQFLNADTLVLRPPDLQSRYKENRIIKITVCLIFTKLFRIRMLPLAVKLLIPMTVQVPGVGRLTIGPPTSVYNFSAIFKF
jgi:hypothetical protein